MKVMYLVIASVIAGGQVVPFVSANGDHHFSYSVHVPKKTRKALEETDQAMELWVSSNLAKLLAAQRWCLDGWEITDQQEIDGNILFVTGKCR